MIVLMDRLCSGLRPYALLSLFSLLIFLPGLATLPPMDRDESRFMQATRQMLESGDYVRIQFQEEMRAKKPAGAYWIQAFFVNTLTHDADRNQPWPYRLPSALACWAVVLMTFGFGRSLVGTKPAFVAAILTGSALMVVSEAHQAKTDALLLACVTLAQGLLARFYVAAKAKDAMAQGSAAASSGCQSGGCSGGSCGSSAPSSSATGSIGTPHLLEILAFWLAIGIGILVKGPIVPMVCLLTIATLAIADRGARWFLAMKPLTGALIAASLAAPWFIAISQATGGEFVGTAVKTDLLPKLLGAQESHGGFPGLYAVLAPAILWPGSLFLMPAILQMWQQRRRVVYRVLLAWAVPTWIVFELVPTKLPHYILPALPALALMTAALAAEGISAFAHRLTRLWYGLWMGLGLAIASLAIIGPWFFGQGVTLPHAVAALGIVLACSLTLVLVWRHRLEMAALSLGLVALATYPVLFHSILPNLDRLFLSRSVMHIVQTIGSDGPVASAGYSEPSLVFLLGTKTRLVDGNAAAEHLAAQPKSLAIVSDKEQDAFLARIGQLGLKTDQFGSVSGLNYSRGKTLTLTVYGVVGP